MLLPQELKIKLLQTGMFIDNDYLNKYIDLIYSQQNISGYSEAHHILQVAYYKHIYKCESREAAELFANNDIDNAIVQLSYMDHCKAHWLLYFCTTSYLRQGNEKAVRYMVEMYKKLTSRDKAIIDFSDTDFALLQSYMDQIMLDPQSRYYSAEEEEILKKYYPEFGLNYCMQFFPNRNEDAVSRYISKLGLKRTNLFWTVDEENFLKENYPKHGIKYCMEKLNRTRLMVKCKANYMGLKVINLTKYNKPWTDLELSILRDNYEKFGIDECVRLIPGHEKTAIQKKASMLDLHHKRVYKRSK